MSVEAMVWVLYNSHTSCGTDKVVLLGIASHADAYGRNAWPSHETLAGYANVDERNVRRAIARLAEQGHITVEVQAGGSTKMRSDRRPNLYSIPGCEGFPQAIRRGGASAPSRSSYGGARVTERGGVGDRDGGALAPSELSLNRPEPSSDEEPTRVTEQAAALHAERAHRDRPGGPANAPSRWKAVAAGEWLTEHANACASYLGEDPTLTPQALLAKIERGTSLPGYRIAAPVALHAVTDDERKRSEADRAAARRTVNPLARDEAAG